MILLDKVAPEHAEEFHRRLHNPAPEDDRTRLSRLLGV